MTIHPQRTAHHPDPDAQDLFLASSPSGMAVMHVFGKAGKVLETLTGTVEEMRSYAADYFPSLPLREN